MAVSMASYQFYTLQRLYHVPTSRVSHVARVCKALRHYRGEWLGIHYEAYLRKISTEITPKLPPRELRHNDMP
jgi:hypothetical protein